MLRILVVDDDPDMRLYLRSCLVRALPAMPEIHEAVDGEDALSILAGREVDLVITDVVMPRMDGLTLCRRLDADQRLSNLPVILLTRESDAARDARVYIRSRERLTLLGKPFSTEGLYRAVADVVDVTGDSADPGSEPA